MYNPKVLSAFNDLQNQSNSIRQGVDVFMADILKWADELGEIIEKEFSASKDTGLFLLPKTPSEKLTRARKARKGLVSKCSVLNSTLSQNETSELDNTISLRTRGAKRMASSKMSQLIDSSVIKINETEKNPKDDATFVLPKGSTRTKPVFKVTQPEPTVAESQTTEHPVLESSENSEKELSFKSVASSPDASHREKTTTQSNSPAQPSNPTEVPIAINETPVERSSRSRTSKTSGESPPQRMTRSNLFRSQSGSPMVRSSKEGVARKPSSSPVTRLSGKKRRSRSQSGVVGSGKVSSSTSQEPKSSVSESRSLLGNKTITIKKEAVSKGSTAYDMFESMDNNDKIPVARNEDFRLTRASTLAMEAENTPIIIEQNGIGMEQMELEENLLSSTRIVDVKSSKNGTVSESMVEEISEDAQVPKKKRKVQKGEEVKENVEEMADTMRITRTKSKAMKKMMEESEAKQADLSAFAKKVLDKAKKTSLKKNRLAALLECNSSTPTNNPARLGNNLPFGKITSSKSKYHLLLSGSKKLKTPLATVPNSGMKIAKMVGEKKTKSADKGKAKVGSRDSSAENLVRTASKPPKDDLDKEIILKSKKEKEEEVALKRQNVIKAKQEELKRKNELKHQMAMKQREKLEQEKYNNMIQLEKEKEERHKLLLQERQNQLKKEAFEKKMRTQQKIAETMERRRMEEEARLAKLKEMEAEEQRLALEKQREQERQEKRAQERLAQKKAQEEYEMQLKQELEAERLRAEKLLTAKKCLPSANKKQKFGVMDKREWDYKPRHENDYGLEDEHSEVDSEDERSYDKAKPATSWGRKVIHGQCPALKVLNLEMLCQFMPCYQKSPDIYKMFRMTPSKRIKRSSSAIWNTPSS